MRRWRTTGQNFIKVKIMTFFFIPHTHKTHTNIRSHEIVLICCRGGRYTEQDAKAIVVQILSVVAFCHLQGVVHRDLKPEVFSFA